MKAVYHIEKLPLKPGQQDALIDDATKRRRFFSLTFTVLDVDKDEKVIILRAKQNKPVHKNVLKSSKIVSLAKSAFQPHLKGYTLHVTPVQYRECEVDIVTPEWIQEQMNILKVSLKQIHSDTGIDKSHLSQMINGKVNISQTSKAMFFYYFKAKSNKALVISKRRGRLPKSSAKATTRIRKVAVKTKSKKRDSVH